MGHDGGVSAAGVVQQLRRYPIKSMLGEVVPLATLTARGLLGDRVGAVIDDETGRVVSVKYPRRWARVLELRAVTDDEGVHVCPTGRMSTDDRASPTSYRRSWAVPGTSRRRRRRMPVRRA
jgi:uncharacterized protein YcbX